MYIQYRYIDMDICIYIYVYMLLGRRSRLLRLQLRNDKSGKQINRSHTHSHTDREQYPDTHTRQEQHPKPSNQHPPQTLNNARRWRDDGACHLPRPVGGPVNTHTGKPHTHTHNSVRWAWSAPPTALERRSRPLGLQLQNEISGQHGVCVCACTYNIDS